MAPQTVPAMQQTATLRKASLVPCLVHPSLAGVGEPPLAQVDCLCGCTLYGLDLFAHILTHPTLQLDFESSVQCSTVGHYLCFHQLLGEGSMVIFKMFMSLTTEQGQFEHPLLYCLGS